MVFGRCRIAGHLLDHRVEHLDIKPGLFLDRTQQQQPGHDLVDLARNTAGRLVQLDPHAPVEFGMLVPADMAQAMLDIGFDLARLHRFEMVCGDDALAELLELVRMRKQLLELGLAEQQRLQQRVRTELEVRQHPQFFERADRQVLRLVDDQQRPAAIARLFVQEHLDRCEVGSLVAARVEPEAARCDMDHFLAIERAGHHFAHGHAVAVELLLEMGHQRRLARTDLAGDDDEAFALVEAVPEIAQRLLVRDAFVIERRVGRELERTLAETVIFFVHLRSPIRNRTAGRAGPMQW